MNYFQLAGKGSGGETTVNSHEGNKLGRK